MFTLAVPALQIVLRSALIYLALFTALRLFGKREVGQFTLYDLVFVLLVANAVQPAMTGPDSSLLGGLIIVATLVALNWIVGRLARLPHVHRFFTSEAAIIIRDGEYLDPALRREGLSREECESAIREHGLDGVAQVHLGVLEPDGSISIVPAESAVGRTRRVRRRFRID